MPNLQLPPITDEEEARIQAGIAADPDNPEVTARSLLRRALLPKPSPNSRRTCAAPAVHRRLRL
jgi:hypothetical protein